MEAALATSHSHGILTPGQLVPPLTRYARLLAGSPLEYNIIEVSGMAGPRQIPTSQEGLKPGIFRSRDGRLS